MNAKKKVLVIDNDRDACDLIRETLAPRGFDVFSYSDPDEALTRAGEIGPDLVFISILFPQSNGLKISRAVHAVEGLEKAPIVMLISYPDELDPKYTSTIGIVDVALKPLKTEDILSKTISILGEGSVYGWIEEAGAGISGAEEPASLDEEWLTFLEKEDVETAGTGSPEIGREETTAEEIRETAEETEDFLREEERNNEPAEGAETMRGFAEGPKGGSMKKFIVIASGVLVVIAGAALGAFLFFHGTQRKAAAPPAKAPAKKEQTVAIQKKESFPPVSRDNVSSGTAPTKAESPAAARQAVDEKPGAENIAKGNAAKPADAKQAAKDRKVYSVQVGAFQNGKNAVALSEKLKKKGYDSFVIKDNSSAVNRVLIGKFDAPGKAAVQAKLVLEKEGLKSIIYHY
jgi:CheY-like chemotaxis protein